MRSSGESRLRRPVITIDGPVGAGKTTVAELVSHTLDFMFVDTGLFYRAVAWFMLQRGLDPDDEGAAAGVAEDLEIGLSRIDPDAVRQSVNINGIDATDELYWPDVESAVSIVAKNIEVRKALLPKQRLMLQAGASLVTVKLVTILAIALLASPTSTHALARAALQSGLQPFTSESKAD